MALPNIFSREVTEKLIERINKLHATSTPGWGKMTVAQMLAHCNVTYEMVYENKHPKPNKFLGFVLRSFVKKYVTNEQPYKRNMRTAAQFLIHEVRDFEKERLRLIDHLNKTQQLGEAHFHNKTSHSFGKLSKEEWNNMFYKHVDHHLTQFGV
ncbi:DUF1569 domain-containing protein [Flavitalea sp.]|nr:DUF1569 domain-containing protein [Flavitalea sp.]